MTRPLVPPYNWASNSLYSGGPGNGRPTKVLPSAGKVAQGWEPTEKPGPQHVNAVLNNHGQWLNYLKDIEWLNWEAVALASYGLTGVGTSMLEGAVGGAGAVNNSLYNKIFVGVTDSEKVLSSPDGRVWTERYSNLNFHSSSATYTKAYWSNLAQKFLIGGYGSSAGYEILSSPDGITWTNRTCPGVVNGILCFAENASIIVAGADANNAIYTSTDGITWTARTLALFTTVALAWNGSVFVAMDNAGQRATSPDGITWTNRGDPNSTPTTPKRGLVWTGSMFVATAGSTRETSPDGITWTLQAPPVDLQGVAASISEMVIDGSVIYGMSGTRDRLYRSSDNGATWDMQRLTAGFGKGMFIGGGRLICFGVINSLPGLLMGMRTTT